MKIRQKSINNFELITGRNGQICRKISCRDFAVFVRARFQSPRRRRADGDNSSVFTFRTINNLRGFNGNLTAFRHHFMFRQIRNAHRLESSVADVQSDFGDFYAEIFDFG